MRPVQVWGGAMHEKGWGLQEPGTAEGSENLNLNLVFQIVIKTYLSRQENRVDFIISVLV